MDSIAHTFRLAKTGRQVTDLITNTALPYLLDMPEIVKEVRVVQGLYAEREDAFTRDNNEYERLDNLVRQSVVALRRRIAELVIDSDSIWQSVRQEIVETCVDEDSIVECLLDEVDDARGKLDA